MNCSELREAAPLYISGELDDAARAVLRRHLAACPACAREIEEQLAADARLIGAFSSALPDTANLERSIRRRIAAPSRQKWMLAAGSIAAMLAFVFVSYQSPRSRSTPKLYAEAARDHRVEVVERQPRHWRAGDAELQTVTSPYGLSLAEARRIAPAGYRLERARICGLNGKRVLHLVYTDDATELSVYVPGRDTKISGGQAAIGAERVTAFRAHRVAGLVVAEASAADCDRMVRSIEAAL
ncbi:MAG TPA: zf-HC2 domain-containing protein [Bryobacteraceae bacterium]|nr:zf-HC2 domain-containing protein [Bryobacteraceae bacterium]